MWKLTFNTARRMGRIGSGNGEKVHASTNSDAGDPDLFSDVVVRSFCLWWVYLTKFINRTTNIPFIPAIIYGSLELFPIEYAQIRGWKPVVSSLPFISLFVGILMAAAVNIANNGYYFKQYRNNGNQAVPEARLLPMMVGAFALTGGLLLFACMSLTSPCSFLLPWSFYHQKRNKVKECTWF